MNGSLATILFAADDGWHHGHWWWHLVWLVFLALVITGAVLLWRRRGGDPARRILSERFARGEIDAEEYRRRRDQL